MMSYHQHTMRPSMNTTPRKSPSAGSRGSTPNKRGNASPSPNKTSTKPKSKQEWNTYLTDHDRFKITKDEQVRRKQLLISKHNILQDFDQPLDTPSKTNAKSPHSISKAVLTPRQDATSLDLLLDSDGIMSESEREAEVSDALKAEAGTTTPMSSKKGKKKAVSSTKAKKAAANKEAASATAMQRRQVMIAEVMASTYTSDPSQDDDEDDEEDDADFAYQLPKQYPSSPIRQNLESTKFTPSPRRKMGSTSSPKGSFAMSSSTQSRRLTTTQTSSQFITTHDQLADKDVQDMSVEIRMLLQEMKYYEELSGKKKVFDSEVSNNWSVYV